VRRPWRSKDGASAASVVNYPVVNLTIGKGEEEEGLLLWIKAGEKKKVSKRGLIHRGDQRRGEIKFLLLKRPKP
jgi:hypothetical protein